MQIARVVPAAVAGVVLSIPVMAQTTWDTTAAVGEITAATAVIALIALAFLGPKIVKRVGKMLG